jgi:ethanolamine utilization microcompartment shell protein EutS
MGLVDSFVGAVFVYGFFVAVELAFGFECFAADLAGYAVYVYTAYGFLMG